MHAHRRSGTSRARGRVYAILRDAIVSAEFEPGQRLSETELAERLGVMGAVCFAGGR